MLTQQQQDMIRNFSINDNQFNDNCKLFTVLGHHFNYNPAVTISNSYNIKGKCTLNATAMIGVVRRQLDANGNEICGGFTVLHSDDKSCTMQAIRLDEQRAALKKAEFLNKPLLVALEKVSDPNSIQYILEQIVKNNDEAAKAGIHTHTFTIEHARQRGKDKDRSWRTMPKAMCVKRCETALARQAFPEIVGTTYSADEYAEMAISNEKERDEIVYASAFGERVPTHSPAPVTPPPAPVTPPPATPNPANPYPRLFQSVQMTASEALHNINILNAKQIDNLSNEIKSYLMGVVFDANPKEFVRTALSKLKIKEYQITVDAIRDFTKSEFKLDEDSLNNHFIDTDIDINAFNQNAHSYINMNVDNVKLDNDSFILYVADCKQAAVSHKLMNS